MFKLKTTLGTNNICGPNLIRIRHEKGLSQRQLAKNLQIAGYDVDHHFIRRIENGERFVTDMELVALAKVLQVEITDLIDPTIPVDSIVANEQDKRLSVQRNVTAVIKKGPACHAADPFCYDFLGAYFRISAKHVSQ